MTLQEQQILKSDKHGRRSILDDIADSRSGGNGNGIHGGSNKGGGHPRPMVARISLWTPRMGSRYPASAGGGGGDDDDDQQSSDSDDEECSELDLELDDNAQLEQRLKMANLPEHVRQVAEKEMQKLRRTPSFMSDYVVTRAYLELLTELPWSAASEEVIDLKKARRDLDNDHYGMQKLKERVLQYLAVRKLRQLKPPASPSSLTGRLCSAQPILMFVGPPGTGKTSIAQSIAASLGRKFHRISLGGVADQSAIRGHRRTYVGSMPGRIIQGIKQAGVNNPVFLLDEVDKMGVGLQGDPSGALLEVLDPEQNHTFTDHYLNIAFDLSRVLFIATANSLDGIPAALLDRMELIQVAGYTQEEKFHIARRHLVPKQVLDSGLTEQQLVFRDEALHRIIGGYAREAGVRTLERRIGTVCRSVAVRIVESAQMGAKQVAAAQLSLPVVVGADSLERFLGPVVYDRESSARANVPGVAIGLAWTANGGEITLVEAQLMRGATKRDSLVLTGQLGSVMRESALLALNWIRANCHLYEALPQTLGRDLVENTVHIHFPAGAVGKDGPSAGVTIVCALMSLCSNLSVAPDLAMTGEITLRGAVLKVGGLKSKVLAAHRAGIRRIIVPARNEPDLSDVPAPIRDKLKFHLVSSVDELIRVAFDDRLPARGQLSPGSSLANKL